MIPSPVQPRRRRETAPVRLGDTSLALRLRREAITEHSRSTKFGIVSLDTPIPGTEGLRLIDVISDKSEPTELEWVDARWNRSSAPLKTVEELWWR
jgi:hypothetical protein